MAVYFIQAGENGPVKIGTTESILRRIALIQNGQAEPVRLLHLFEGGREEEQALHRRFREYRLRGEWFRPASEIIAGDVGLAPMAVPAPERKAYSCLSWSEEAKLSAAQKRAARWADPVWAAARRERYRADGPKLREKYWRQELKRIADAALSWRADGREDLAKACIDMARRPAQVLHEITGLSFHELRPDVFPVPERTPA
ncbi:GIY-YIG nuclease family protein [Roseomonas chloroacetimidivorans]|uniref:GIY-YIG nuclease family protein n=1 Tax=Roseomonas chloroacetimidivorans TaxID=1766656 RepID=UPI003C733FBB